jgi:hypothetical protein
VTTAKVNTAFDIIIIIIIIIIIVIIIIDSKVNKIIT